MDLDGGGRDLTKNGPGTLVLDKARHLGGVTIGGGVIELVGGGTSVLVTEALAIDPAAALELTDGSLIVDYTGGASPFGTVAGWVASGYDGGSWEGLGIRSSEAAAVGIIPPDSDDSAPIASLGAIAVLRQQAQLHVSRQQYDKAAGAYASAVERMGVHRAPLATYAPSSVPARAYEELWAEIKSRVRGR